MARVSYVEAATAPAEVLEIYEKTLRGNPGSIQKALAHRPEILKTFLPFYASVGRALDRKLFELVYIRISIINDCHYCLQHHLSSSKKAGVTPEDWQALKAGKYDRFTDREKTALAYAEKVTRMPRDANDADFVTLKKYFSEPEIVDLQMLIGLVNLTNRVTGPLNLDVEFPEEKI